jgi:hypothetical protein
MKKFVLPLLLAAALSARGAAPTSDIALGVTLLPNTEYTVTATVQTDGDGNVLGQVDVQELIDSLSGLVGEVSKLVQFTLVTGTETVTDVVGRVLDSPAVEVGDIEIAPPAAAVQPGDASPSVRVTSRRAVRGKLRLRGTAADDRAIARVEVNTNGKLRVARGTTAWLFLARLRPGRNHLVVRAFDDANHASAPRRLTVRSR